MTVEAAALCLKAGNAVILRGGSEAIHSNKALGELIARGLANVGLPAASAQVVPVVDREAVGAMLTLPQYIDMVVPRGGKALIERVSEETGNKTGTFYWTLRKPWDAMRTLRCTLKIPEDF